MNAKQEAALRRKIAMMLVETIGAGNTEERVTMMANGNEFTFETDAGYVEGRIYHGHPMRPGHFYAPWVHLKVSNPKAEGLPIEVNRVNGKWNWYFLETLEGRSALSEALAALRARNGIVFGAPPP